MMRLLQASIMALASAKLSNVPASVQSPLHNIVFEGLAPNIFIIHSGNFMLPTGRRLKSLNNIPYLLVKAIGSHYRLLSLNAIGEGAIKVLPTA